MKILFTTFIAAVFASSLAQAGWVGGGGAFIEDDDNPWFIQNTPFVTYCIWADEQNFGLTREHLSRLSADAFQFWKNQTKKIKYIDYMDQYKHRARIEVATQNFSEVSCNRNPDITLQFGTLTDIQKDYLRDPTKYAGISVRTDYNRVSLRGKGFVYLSPQSGPLKMKRTRLDQPWSYRDGILAQIILTHELGHVFGFQHDDANFLTSSGIANILEYPPLSLNFIERQFARLNTGKDSLFTYDNAMSNGYSGRPDLLQKLWGTTPQETNVTVRVEDGRFFVYASTDSSSGESRRLVGTATLRKKEFGSNRRVGYFWFPKEQNVFPGFSMDTPTSFGSTHSTAHYEGTYRSMNGSVTRSIKVTTHSPYGIDVGGELDGKMFIDFWQGI